MTGYQSKKAAALDEDGMYLVHHTQPAQEPTVERAWFTIAELNAWADKKLSENPHWAMPKVDDDDDTQVYKDNGDLAVIAYQSGYYDGKKAALAGRERNFCERCGKRTANLTVIHTCTPPKENT